MNSKTKILLLITQSHWGGAQRYVVDVASLLSNDFAVTVACGGDWDQSKVQSLKHALSLAEGSKVEFKVFKFFVREICPIKDLLCLWQLYRYIRKEKFDIVHTNSSKAEILGNLAAWLAGTKRIVFTAHGFVFNEPGSTLKKRLYIWLERFANLFSDKVICVSEADRQSALACRICSAEKLVTIHNGINSPDYEIEVNKAEKKVSLGLEPDDFVIGTVANFYPTKGLPFLIDAAAIVLKSYPKARFVFVGEGEERSKIQDQISNISISNISISNSIKILGSRTDIAEILKTLDIFVLPSLKEGLPYAIIESFAAGVPVIATKVGGVPELVHDESTGILVPPADSEDLSKAIIRLIEDEALRTRLSKAAQELVAGEFTVERMIERTREAYDCPPAPLLR